MTKFVLTLVAIAGTLAANALEIQCTGCNAKVLPGDRFCPNCGARFEEPGHEEPLPKPMSEPRYLPSSPTPSAEQSDYWNKVENHEPGHALPVPMGMLRGLAEIACSPIEIVRAASILESSIIDAGKRNGNPLETLAGTVMAVPVGACIMGGIGTALDAAFGALDVVSFGTLGNAYWDGDNSTPYVFGRYWTTGSHYTKGVWF